MIKVRYQNDSDQECIIRPTPFVQVNLQHLKNKEGNFGTTYTITLTGTLLTSEGTPYAVDPNGLVYPDFENNELGGIGPYLSFDNIGISQRARPPRQKGPDFRPAAAILSKQRSLRALFAKEGQAVIITDIIDDMPATVWCNPRVVSIDFSDGVYVDKCDYTIVLEADALYRGDVIDEAPVEEEVTNALILASGQYIEDYSEDWNIEVDDSQGESLENPRSYRISHSLNATGKSFYDASGVLVKPAWQQAKDFLLTRTSDNPYESYPNIFGKIGSGTVNLIDSYKGFNQVRTESINVAQGSFSITENWLLSSGIELENYNISTSTSNSDPFVSVSIDGSIKGLTSINPSGYGGTDTTDKNTAYENARLKWLKVSNDGQFGLASDIFKRASNVVSVALNAQPLSVSVATNEYTGEINYALEFNNRPTNIITGTLTEDITINDTYPGDVFATIPVLGRATGPVLQYLGGRTEYKRDIQINLLMDYTKIPYGSQRDPLLYKKPSLVNPTSTELANLLEQLSPKGEPGVRKYFVAPPTENWSPKTGSYSFSVSFTYELDK